MNYLLTFFQNKNFTFLGDYNINPYCFSKTSQDRHGDIIPFHNSIILTKGTDRPTTVTVDAALFSNRKKQLNYCALQQIGLFSELKAERSLALKTIEALDHEQDQFGRAIPTTQF